MTAKNLDKSNTNVRLSILLVSIMIVWVSILIFNKCGRQAAIEPVGDSGPRQCSDGLAVGETKEEACANNEAGKKIYVCKISGQSSVLVSSTCAGEKPPECAKLTYEEDLKPLLQAKCAECHAGFVNYEVATKRIDEWIRRINLGAEDQLRMPKKPASQLELGEKDLFQGWKRDGLVKSKADCGTVNTGSTLDDAYIETEIFDDINRIDGQDREFTRWAIIAHKYNQGLKMPLGKDAVDKALNSIVEKERTIVLSSYIDEKKTILRFDIRSFGLDEKDWGFIEQFDNSIDIESFTDKGKAIKLLTKSRKPFIHFDNLLDQLNNPRLYHFFLNIPQTEQELFRKIGVNYNNDLAQLNATLVGNDDSSLTNQHNRLVSRFDSLDGYLYKTYDTGSLNGDLRKNLFSNPLLRETGSNQAFKFEGSELIFSLPNGAQGYMLVNAAGQRINEAPVDIVRNLQSSVPPAPAIATGIATCSQCHANGIIPMRDEIRAHVIAHGDEFGSNDVLRVKSLYKQQTSLNALYNLDNKRFAKFLEAVGITPGGVDPITVFRNDLYYNYDENKAAAFLFMPLVKFRECVSNSNTLRRELGSLLTGGTIPFDQFRQLLKRTYTNYPNEGQISVLQTECRFFLEKIDGN